MALEGSVNMCEHPPHKSQTGDVIGHKVWTEWLFPFSLFYCSVLSCEMVNVPIYIPIDALRVI